MDVYLDDLNITDSGASFGGSPGTTYPTTASDDDMLLYFYAEEYLGEWLFWWRKTSASGNPDVYPDGYATDTPAGVDLTTTAFNEVNFAYQLAQFCYDVSVNHNECLGFIGVKPPVSTSLRDVSRWLGKPPTYTVTAGVSAIASAGDNGTGLMGNKYIYNCMPYTDQS